MAREQAAGSLTEPRDPVTGSPEATGIVPPRRAAPWPSVTVIVPTRDRPVMLDRAVRSIAGQSYPGEIECVIVFDQSDPAPVDAELPASRRIRLLTNTRTPGAAGARNTGVTASDGAVVAFCDDDDVWAADKLRLQVELLDRAPLGFVACGIRVHYADRVIARPAPGSTSFQQLVRDRHAELGLPTFVLRRTALAEIGLLDEQVPGSSGEDYDFLLRAARRGPIDAVRQPLVDVFWHQQSFFTQHWQTIADGLEYLLGKHPELAADPRDGPGSRARPRSPMLPSRIERLPGKPVSGRCAATRSNGGPTSRLRWRLASFRPRRSSASRTGGAGGSSERSTTS